METLIVLSALVCVIIAAPTLYGGDFQDIKTTTWSPLLTLIREKKSPQQSTDFDKFSDIGTSSTNGQDFDSTLPMGRSFAFKKPIIVKKKVGYHLYRDSDEEKELSNSRESCNDRVKVKLCDEKQVPNSMRMKSSTIEDINNHIMSEEEMKHSLIMAKEAIANLERDLKKIDIKQDTTLIGPKNDGTSIDEIVHKDIDMARQALEHIQENIGNIDSLTFHGTTLKDADEMHDIHVTVAKSEEEKIVQWKEAMENIQKNVDIARNIEDSFRSPTRSMPLEEFGNTGNNNSEAPEENNVHKLRNKDELQSTTEHAMEEDMQCNSQIIKINPKEKDVKDNDHLENDMNASATAINESETEFIDRNVMRNDHSENMHNEKTSQFSKTIPPENMNFNRNAEFDLSKTDKSDTTFTHDQATNTKTEEDKLFQEKLASNNNFKTDLETAGSNHEIKSTDTRPIQAKSDLHKLKHKDELAHSAALIDNVNKIDIKFHDKTGNHFDPEHHNEVNGIKKHKKHKEQFQQDEQLPETLPITNKVFDNTDSKTKLLENSNHFQGKNQQIDNFVKKGDETHEVNQHININPQDTSKLTFMQWSPERMSNVDQTTLVKEAEEFNNQNELRTNSGFNNPTQLTSTMKTSNNFNGMRHHHMQIGHVEKKHDHMTHGMSLVDSRFRPTHLQHKHWKSTHENARSAYTPAVETASARTGSETNAVGLFPNANVGACSVPLLISCAPSVISGSLAKAIPAGYGASAFRTEDDFNFFPNKREIKKPNEMPSTKSNKLPPTKKMRATISSDNKQ